MNLPLGLLLVCSVASALPKPGHYWGEEDCGWSRYEDAGIDKDELHIVGGWESRPHEFPYQVGLIWQGSFICGGSLIDSNHVITAAHCVVDDSPSVLSVVLGDHYRSQENGFKRTVAVADNLWHPDYDITGNIENDIAILTLREVIYFTEGVQPVCPPTTGQDDYVGRTATVSGWGSVRQNPSQVVDELRYTNLPIMDYDSCVNSFQEGWIEPGMLCAGVDGSNDRDSCQGDSGGPLAVKNGDKQFELVGVVSWGIGCAGSTPGVYADVAYFEQWIDDNIEV